MQSTYWQRVKIGHKKLQSKKLIRSALNEGEFPQRISLQYIVTWWSD
jgi:hypothetical protein